MNAVLRALALTAAPVSWSAWAAEAQGGAASATAVSAAGLFQILFALIAVLAAIFATAWLLKRLGAGQLGPGGALKVLGGVAVGPRERLVLVEVGEVWLVVGVAPGQVRAVHTMPRPAELPQTPTTDAVSPFADRLRQLLGKRRA